MMRKAALLAAKYLPELASQAEAIVGIGGLELESLQLDYGMCAYRVRTLRNGELLLEEIGLRREHAGNL